MLQSVAVMGPARLGVPLTQALTAPLLGRLSARRVAIGWQIVLCGAIRGVENAIATALFILVIAGGIDAYAGSYDAVSAQLPLLPRGPAAAIELTLASLIVWTVIASTVQVLVYRRGLRRWATVERAETEGRPPQAPATVEAERPQRAHSRFDPRAVAVAAAVAVVLLLVSTSAMLLGAVAVWLVVATLAAGRVDRGALPAGFALAGILALSGLTFTLVGGLGLELALRRGARAGLLVLVATWLRAVAGSDGLREVSRRSLTKLRRVPALTEASRTFDDLGSAPRLLSAGRSLFAALGPVRKRPVPLLDAILAWIPREAERFHEVAARARPSIAVRARDVALVAFATAPLATLVPALA